MCELRYGVAVRRSDASQGYACRAVTAVIALAAFASVLPLPRALSQVFDVLDYGAIPNDGNDDSTAFDAAVSACLSSPTGGVVYFPAGTYVTYGIRVSPTLANIAKSISFAGDGESTIIDKYGNDFHCFDVRGIGFSQRRIGTRLSDIRIRFREPQLFPSVFRAEYCNDLIIQGLHVEGTIANTGNDGILLFACFNTRIVNSRLERLTGIGILVSGIPVGQAVHQAVDTYLTNVLIDGGPEEPRNTSLYSLLIDSGTSGVYAVNCDFAQGRHGVVVWNSVAPLHRPEFLFFTQVLADQTEREGWYMLSGQSVSLTACWASTSWQADGFRIAGARDVRLTNCIAVNNHRNGLYANSTTHELQVIGGTFAMNSRAGAQQFDGIGIGANTRNFQLSGVRSGDNWDGVSTFRQRYGIFIAAGTSDRYVVHGCRLLDNTIGGLYDGGALAFSKVVADNLQ